MGRRRGGGGSSGLLEVIGLIVVIALIWSLATGTPFWDFFK